MALSLESPSKVRIKARAELLDPLVFMSLKSFFFYWSQYKKHSLLQFVAFSEADCDDADGTGVVDAACTLYAVYVKKDTTATDNYFKVYDSATVDTTAGEQILALPLLTASESQYWFSNSGVPMANGVTVTQHTTSIGTTDGSDGGSGFLIVGAA